MELVALWFIVRQIMVSINERQTKKVTKRAAERALLKSTLERNGYTVVIDAATGNVGHYFKSGDPAAGSCSASESSYV